MTAAAFTPDPLLARAARLRALLWDAVGDELRTAPGCRARNRPT